MQIKVSGPLGLLSLFQSFKDRVPHKPGGGGGGWMRVSVVHFITRHVQV